MGRRVCLISGAALKIDENAIPMIRSAGPDGAPSATSLPPGQAAGSRSTAPPSGRNAEFVVPQSMNRRSPQM
ncbi:hypothetical protein [Massilia luteola]|uniref:hypothetical protein n=1 Tax=Massilia luteola TaxID=3081751 RepID=UPI002ACC01E3|nr:hypothetical protein [Massilia sp. Gc5]